MSEYDSTLPQRVQRAYEEVSSRFHDEKVRRQVLAMLIRNDSLTLDDIKKSIEIAEEIQKQEQLQQEKRDAEQKHLKEICDQPDSKIPQLWRAKDTQPSRLIEYLQSYDMKMLEKYLAELKARPLHYISQFPQGELSQVVTFLEQQLEKRKNEPRRQTPLSYTA